MRKKRVSIGVVIALMALTATLTLTLTYQYAMNRFNDQVKNVAERQKMYTRLYQIDTRVREFFLFSVDDNTIYDAIAEGYINGLGDDSTRYLTQSACTEAKQQMAGMATGIGIDFAMYGTTRMIVTRVIDGAPAELAGIQAGDYLVSINGKVLDDSWTIEQTEKALAGDAGTEVILTVQRTSAEGIPEDHSFTITRRQYETQTVTYRTVGNIGYIRIYSFTDNTDDEFESALIALANSGVGGLIIDVRNNGGGVMESAADILDTLLPAGTIVSQSGKDGQKKVLYSSDVGQTDLPLIVLVNENTASAAELLAAAVKDYGKGRVVGVQTRGKGTIQELHTFSDGTGIYLTTAYFYPPLSAGFDGVGVSPDVKVEMNYTGSLDLLDETTDTQLGAALNLLNQTGQFAPVDPDSMTSSGTSSDETVSGEGVVSGEGTASEGVSSEAEDTSVSSDIVAWAKDCADFGRG